MRSIEQNLIDIDRVFVVGVDPGFLSDNAIFVPCGDPYDQKHKNMLYKIQYCIEHTDISDIFLVSSDDIFMMEKMYCENIPCYYRCKLRNVLVEPFLNNEKSYEYNLYFTRCFLQKYDLPTYQFAIHTLHVIDRGVFKKYKNIINSVYNLHLGVEPFCLLNNMMLKQNPNLKIEIATDAKIVYAEGHDDFCMKTRRKPFFSCNDDSLKNGGMEVIEEYWPNKSKWEK